MATKVREHKNRYKALDLCHVLGNSCKHNRQFAHCPRARVVAYVASSVVVVLNYETKKQKFLRMEKEKAKLVSCLTLSKDGKFLAIGQSGNSPSIIIYDVDAGFHSLFLLPLFLIPVQVRFYKLSNLSTPSV
jgi:tricorn protease-like protein